MITLTYYKVMNYTEAKKVLEKQDAAKAVLARYEKLANAHAKHGFKSRRDFIQALKELDKGAPVRKRAVRRGVKRRRRGGGGRGLSAEAIEKIKSLKAAGKSNAEISRTTKVSPMTVAKYVGKARKKA